MLRYIANICLPSRRTQVVPITSSDEIEKKELIKINDSRSQQTNKSSIYVHNKALYDYIALVLDNVNIHMIEEDIQINPLVLVQFSLSSSSSSASTSMLNFDNQDNEDVNVNQVLVGMIYCSIRLKTWDSLLNIDNVLLFLENSNNLLEIDYFQLVTSINRDMNKKSLELVFLLISCTSLILMDTFEIITTTTISSNKLILLLKEIDKFIHCIHKYGHQLISIDNPQIKLLWCQILSQLCVFVHKFIIQYKVILRDNNNNLITSNDIISYYLSWIYILSSYIALTKFIQSNIFHLLSVLYWTMISTIITTLYNTNGNGNGNGNSNGNGIGNGNGNSNNNSNSKDMILNEEINQFRRSGKNVHMLTITSASPLELQNELVKYFSLTPIYETTISYNNNSISSLKSNLFRFGRLKVINTNTTNTTNTTTTNTLIKDDLMTISWRESRLRWMITSLISLIDIGSTNTFDNKVIIAQRFEWINALSEGIIYCLSVGPFTLSFFLRNNKNKRNSHNNPSACITATLLIILLQLFHNNNRSTGSDLNQYDTFIFDLDQKMRYFIDSYRRIKKLNIQTIKRMESNSYNRIKASILMKGVSSQYSVATKTNSDIDDDNVSISRHLEVNAMTNRSSHSQEEHSPIGTLLVSPESYRMQHQSITLPSELSFKINEDVMVRYTLTNKTQRWFPGMITDVKIGDINTYTIRYQDGEIQSGVHEKDIKLVNERSDDKKTTKRGSNFSTASTIQLGANRNRPEVTSLALSEIQSSKVSPQTDLENVGSLTVSSRSSNSDEDSTIFTIPLVLQSHHTITTRESIEIPPVELSEIDFQGSSFAIPGQVSLSGALLAEKFYESPRSYQSSMKLKVTTGNSNSNSIESPTKATGRSSSTPESQTTTGMTQSRNHRSSHTRNVSHHEPNSSHPSPTHYLDSQASRSASNISPTRVQSKSSNSLSSYHNVGVLGERESSSTLNNHFDPSRRESHLSVNLTRRISRLTIGSFEGNGIYDSDTFNTSNPITNANEMNIIDENLVTSWARPACLMSLALLERSFYDSSLLDPCICFQKQSALISGYSNTYLRLTDLDPNVIMNHEYEQEHEHEHDEEDDVNGLRKSSYGFGNSTSMAPQQVNLLFSIREYIEISPNPYLSNLLNEYASVTNMNMLRLIKLLQSTSLMNNPQNCIIKHMESIEDSLKIGEGGFGNVYCCVCSNKTCGKYHSIVTFRSKIHTIKKTNSLKTKSSTSLNSKSSSNIELMTITTNLSTPLPMNPMISQDNVIVAIKRISREKSIHDQAIIFDIYNEVTCLEILTKHIGVCNIYDYGIYSNEYWLVMEYGGRYNLHDWRKNWIHISKSGIRYEQDTISSNSPSSSSSSSNTEPLDFIGLVFCLMLYIDAIYIIRDIHKKDIAHFDIKCHNFIVRPDKLNLLHMKQCHDMGQVSEALMIIDFGEAIPFISKYNQHILEMMNEKKTNFLKIRCRGTLFIQSPEQLSINSEGDKKKDANRSISFPIPNQSSDIWSLGCMFVELITSSLLFHDCSWPDLYVRCCLQQFMPLPLESFHNEIQSFSLSLREMMEDILIKTIQQLPSDRISIDKLILLMKDILVQSLQDYRILRNQLHLTNSDILLELEHDATSILLSLDNQGNNLLPPILSNELNGMLTSTKHKNLPELKENEITMKTLKNMRPCLVYFGHGLYLHIQGSLTIGNQSQSPIDTDFNDINIASYLHTIDELVTSSGLYQYVFRNRQKLLNIQAQGIDNCKILQITQIQIETASLNNSQYNSIPNSPINANLRRKSRLFDSPIYHIDKHLNEYLVPLMSKKSYVSNTPTATISSKAQGNLGNGSYFNFSFMANIPTIEESLSNGSIQQNINIDQNTITDSLDYDLLTHIVLTMISDALLHFSSYQHNKKSVVITILPFSSNVNKDSYPSITGLPEEYDYLVTHLTIVNVVIDYLSYYLSQQENQEIVNFMNVNRVMPNIFNSCDYDLYCYLFRQIELSF